MPGTDEYALRLDRVDKRFHVGKRTVEALRGADLKVRRGAVTGLIGPDGAGKTTLMRLAAGLLRADAGKVSVLGLDADHDALKVQSSIGYMPQRFGLYEDLTVRENLNLYADLQGLPDEARAPRHQELMHMTGLGPFIERLAGRLSGGMKQKLGLACTLVRPPRLLLLDEPTVGVDPVSRRELWSIVYRLVQEEQMTVLLSTAYLDEAERCAEVILMHQGQVFSQGSPASFGHHLKGRTYAVEVPQSSSKRSLQSRLARQQARLEQAGRREQVLRSELAELAQRRDEAQQALIEAERARDEAAAGLEGRAEERRVLDEAQRARRQAVETARSGLRTAGERAREIATRLEMARTRLRALDEAQQRSTQRLEQITRRRESLEQQIREAGTPGRDLAGELQSLLERRAASQAALEEARRRLEAGEHALRDVGDRHRQAEQDYLALRDELDAARLAGQEAQVRRQTLVEQLAEIGGEPAALLEGLDPSADESAWQDRLAALDGRIQRLGPINLAAIEEYEQESERRGYLDEQARDLDEALTTLQRAIEKIDNETKTRFRETFDRVNERLADLYPRLFGGGMARLEMIGDDLLDAGIAVVARPPGKRNSSIQQLSGGEKALTASALVFALFELNPAPFCMLDEVDAPLDDSNAARLCRLVEAMSERVQFIYITHNKIAMEMAEQLLGVTMFEPGVSRIVAVDVTEATELAATA